MALATNIAREPINWSSGSVGEGALNIGHTDNGPPTAIAASSDDNDPCFATGQDCSSWTNQKRTHSLSNGEVIWDLSGNVWEWTTYVIADNSKKPTGDGVHEYSEFSTVDYTGSGMTSSQFIPYPSWTTSQGVGDYWSGPQGSGGHFVAVIALTQIIGLVFLARFFSMMPRFRLIPLVSVAFVSESSVILKGL